MIGNHFQSQKCLQQNLPRVNAPLSLTHQSCWHNYPECFSLVHFFTVITCISSKCSQHYLVAGCNVIKYQDITICSHNAAAARTEIPVYAAVPRRISYTGARGQTPQFCAARIPRRGRGLGGAAGTRQRLEAASSCWVLVAWQLKRAAAWRRGGCSSGFPVVRVCNERHTGARYPRS